MAGTLKILNSLEPQVSQVPTVAGLPLFMVMRLGSLITFFPQHLTQYASMITPFSR
jgi:hypothetical protein